MRRYTELTLEPLSADESVALLAARSDRLEAESREALGQITIG